MTTFTTSWPAVWSMSVPATKDYPYQANTLKDPKEGVWIPAKNNTTIKVGRTISTHAESSVMNSSERITPGWWSEDLTEEDIQISLMSNEEVMAEIVAMAGSWADRPDVIDDIMQAHNSWDDRIEELYGKEGDTP